MKYIATVHGKKFEIEINREGEVWVNGTMRHVDFRAMEGSNVYSLLLDNRSIEAAIDSHDEVYNVLITGALYEAKVIDERYQRLMAMAGGSLGSESGETIIRSPMPGTIVKIPVQEGDIVKAGQTVIVLESMKMENELKAPYAGVISRIYVTTGNSVEQNKPLVTITAETTPDDKS
jgi:pyruvate carboxylase subunit B